MRTAAGEIAAVNGDLEDRRALNILRLLQARTAASVFSDNLRNYGDVGELIDSLAAQGFLEITDANGRQRNSVAQANNSANGSGGFSISSLFQRMKKKPAKQAPVADEPPRAEQAKTIQPKQSQPELSAGGIPLPDVEYGFSSDEGDGGATTPAQQEPAPDQEIENSFLSKYAPKVAKRAKRS